MQTAESMIVLLPRFTTLAGNCDFATAPIDVSRFASVQLEVGRSAELRPAFPVIARLYLEESLDCVTWTLGASAMKPYLLRPGKVKFFSYGFRLRWFRLRIAMELATGHDNIITCWAEGILR